jgi:hypothetical protein
MFTTATAAITTALPFGFEMYFFSFCIVFVLLFGFKLVLRIHDILVLIRIWIRGFVPLTNGSGCGSGSS